MIRASKDVLRWPHSIQSKSAFTMIQLHFTSKYDFQYSVIFLSDSLFNSVLSDVVSGIMRCGIITADKLYRVA